MDLDLRESFPSAALQLLEHALDLSVDKTTATYGWGGKSVGFQTSRGTWLRIIFRPETELNERSWTGEECASALTDISKPRLLRTLRWLSETPGFVWRGDELTLAASPTLSPTPFLTFPLELPEEWWDCLSASLSRLGNHKTQRVGVRQDLVTRRINEFTGGAVDPKVTEWKTAHADLHWSNLTGPNLQILDWEGWGLGPRGLDPATLWAYSLLVPELGDEIRARFSEDLSSRDGKLAQLFMCVELLRMITLFGDHPDLKDPLEQASKDLVRELARTM